MTTRGGKKPQRGSWSSHSSRRLGRRHSCADLYPGTCWHLTSSSTQAGEVDRLEGRASSSQGHLQDDVELTVFLSPLSEDENMWFGMGDNSLTRMGFNVALIYSLRISYIDTMYVGYILPLIPSTPSHPTSPDHPCVPHNHNLFFKKEPTESN